MKQPAAQFILATPPDKVQAASAFQLPLAHAAYRIGEGPHLFRAGSPALPRDGLMMIGEEHFGGEGDVTAFCQEVVRECIARNFTGIVFDLESKPTPAAARIISILHQQCARRKWGFFLPEPYSNYSDRANIMISSALSGGSLKHRLREATSRYGPNRITLCIDRTAEDFFLPAPEGAGRRLSREELHKRMKVLSPSVFFSHELCAHYFTYMSRDSGAHFVLFDDAGSIRKKIDLAQELGIRRFFLYYAQMDDLLPEVFPAGHI